MDVNTEILIQTVQNYKVLYDTSHKDYKNNRIKNKIWDSIAEIIGQSDGDTLKKQWKNLRDSYSKHLRSCKTSTGQAAKLIDRYKTWPWANQMSFLRPHLEFAETSSNIQRNTDDEAGSSQATDRTPSTNTAPSQPNGLSQSLQNDTHVHSRRKRTSDGTQSQVDKVIDFISNNTEKDDDTDLLFKSYAKKLKSMSDRRQALVKFEIAKIMFKAELEESNNERNSENMVMIVQQPLSSAGSDVNDPIYIVSSPSPASESFDPLLPPPSDIQPSYTQPSHSEPSHSRPSLTQPLYTQPSHIQPSLTQQLYTQPSHIQPSLTQQLYSQPSCTQDVNDSIYIVSSPSPASESVDPSLPPPSYTQPSHLNPSHNQPSLTLPSYTQPSQTRPSLTQRLYIQPSPTQPSCTQPSHTQPSPTQPLLYIQPSYTQPSRTQTQNKDTKIYYEKFGKNI